LRNIRGGGGGGGKNEGKGREKGGGLKHARGPMNIYKRVGRSGSFVY